MDIQALIQQLLRAGDHPHPDLLAAILAWEEAAVAPLNAIISDPEMYWDRRRSQPRWLPEIAMGLLGDLRAEAAVPILIQPYEDGRAHWPKARQLLKKLLEAKPFNPVANFYYGLVCEDLEEKERRLWLVQAILPSSKIPMVYPWTPT